MKLLKYNTRRNFCYIIQLKFSISKLVQYIYIAMKKQGTLLLTILATF
jgi:hypothetical protein